jgi:HD-GYP domain-containing protein (c-di-GMP phosphodiesterase class II)
MYLEDTSTYIPVNLETIQIGKVREFDLYIKLGGKIALYHSGGSIFTEELNKKLARKASKLYIRGEDKSAYHEYIESNLKDLLADPSVSIEHKAAISHASVSQIAESVFQDPEKETLKRYKSVVSSTMDLILTENDALRNIMKLTSYDFSTYIHSVNVGIFAIALAKDLFGNSNDHNMHELAIGFFLHDIGKCNIPLEVLNKPGPLNDEEWAIMRKHPEMGHEVLVDRNELTEEAKVIVMQHHERNDGSGYPHGLHDEKIHIYSKICCIADVFDALTAKRPYKEPLSTYKALKIMKDEMNDNFEKDFFARFVYIFSQNEFKKQY